MSFWGSESYKNLGGDTSHRGSSTSVSLKELLALADKVKALHEDIYLDVSASADYEACVDEITLSFSAKIKTEDLLCGEKMKIWEEEKLNEPEIKRIAQEALDLKYLQSAKKQVAYLEKKLGKAKTPKAQSNE